MSLRIFLTPLCALSLAFAPAAAAAVEDKPEQQLKQTISDVLDILHSGDAKSLEQKRSEILDLLQNRFSFDIIIRRSLGRNWNELNAQQQDRITVLISDLLIRAYTKELQNGARPQINFVKTEDLGSNKLEIATTVSLGKSMVSVNYRLANIKNRGWQVYDVLVEGVSMVSNYRQQFDEHFQTKSAKELLDMLEQKIKEYDV